jgi:hypothetical protein
MLLSRPDNLKAEHHDLLARLTAACPEMTPPPSPSREATPARWQAPGALPGSKRSPLRTPQ